MLEYELVEDEGDGRGRSRRINIITRSLHATMIFRRTYV